MSADEAETELLHESMFPYIPSRDNSMPSLPSINFIPLPLSLSQFDFGDSEGHFHAPTLPASDAPASKEVAMKRPPLRASYTSFNLSEEHSASPLFIRRKPVPPPKPTLQVVADTPAPEKPVKPYPLQANKVPPPLPSRAGKPGPTEPVTTVWTPVDDSGKTGVKKNLIRQMKARLSEMVGESSAESKQRWILSGIQEPLLSEYSCKYKAADKNVRGYLMISEHYLCFISLLQQDSRLVNRIIIPFECILFVAQKPLMKKNGSTSMSAKTVELATNDKVFHIFYGFKKSYYRAYNVILHAWKSARLQ